MSTERRASLKQMAKGLCRGCGQPVGKGRRTWCSDACVQRALIKLDPSVARFSVHERDHGICARCGFDADKAGRIIERLRSDLWRHDGRSVNWDATIDALQVLHRAFGVRASHWSRTYHLWEADHILPVVEGGGGCELENYRTLCLACHRAETKALAARRARQRREAKLTLLGAVEEHEHVS